MNNRLFIDSTGDVLFIPDLDSQLQQTSAESVPTQVTVEQAKNGVNQLLQQGASEISAMEKMALTSPNQNYVDTAQASQQFITNVFSGAPLDNSHLMPKLTRSIANPATSMAVHAYQHNANAVFMAAFGVVCAATFVEIVSRRDTAGPGAALNPRQALLDTVIGFAPRVGYRLTGLAFTMKDLPIVPFVDKKVVDAFVSEVGGTTLPNTVIFKRLPNFVGRIAGWLGLWFEESDKVVTVVNSSLTKAMADFFNAVVFYAVSPTIDALARLMGPPAPIQSTGRQVGTAIVKSAATRVVANQVLIPGMTVFAGGGGTTTAITTALRSVSTLPVTTAIVGGALAVRAIQVGPSQTAGEVMTMASNTMNGAKDVAQNTAGFFYNHPWLTAGLTATVGLGAVAAYTHSNSQ